MSKTDLSFLRDFCRGDQFRMAEYIKIFLGSLPEILKDISAAKESGDVVSLGKALHALKPQVTFLGLGGLTDQIENLEQMVDQSASASALEPLLSNLHSTLEQRAGELVESLLELS